MKISSVKKAIFEEWEKALSEYYRFGDDNAISKFANKYSDDYNILRRMNLKRIAVKDTIEPLFMVGEDVYWFTLTFNNRKDINSVEWKRKEAQKFLGSIAPLYLMVEEYSENRTKRYHIHGFCIRKYSLTEDEFFNEFRKWHSRQNIRLYKDIKQCLKRVRYITKYIVKDIPKIRRSKGMSKLFNYYKSIKKLRSSFPTLLIDRLVQFYNSEITLNYLVDDDFFYKLNCPF